MKEEREQALAALHIILRIIFYLKHQFRSELSTSILEKGCKQKLSKGL
jgi:hypothetical protein